MVCSAPRSEAKRTNVLVTSTCSAKPTSTEAMILSRNAGSMGIQASVRRATLEPFGSCDLVPVEQTSQSLIRQATDAIRRPQQGWKNHGQAERADRREGYGCRGGQNCRRRRQERGDGCARGRGGGRRRRSRRARGAGPPVNREQGAASVAFAAGGSAGYGTSDQAPGTTKGCGQTWACACEEDCGERRACGREEACRHLEQEKSRSAERRSKEDWSEKGRGEQNRQ